MNYFLIFIIFILINLINIFDSTDIYVLMIMGTTNFIVSTITLYKNRNSPFGGPLFLFISYILYSILIGRYINPDDFPINKIIDYNYDATAQLLILIFMAILMLNNFKNSILILRPNNINSNIINIISISMALLGFLLTLLFTDKGSEGEYGYSPLYEYSIIFFIFSLYYAKFANRITASLVLFLAILVIARDFGMGHRATGLQIALLIYITNFYSFYSFKRLLLVFLPSIFLSHIITIYRINYSLNIEMVISEIMDSFSRNFFASDTSVYAYVASLTFISVHELMSFSELINDSVNFIISQFSYSYYGESLYSISKLYYQHSNGGILPIYLYYYFGLFSIIIPGPLVAYYLKLGSRPMQEYSFFVFAYIFATFPRWLLYAPTQLMRGVFLLSICSFILFIYKRFMVTILIPNVNLN